MSIGEQLRQARNEAGLTIAQVAARSGFTGSHISQIERDLAEPSIGALGRICRAIGIRMGTLFLDDSLTKSGASGPADLVGIVEAEQRATIVPPGSRIRHELLCPDLQHTMEAFRTIIPPGRLAFAGHDLVQSGYEAANHLATLLNGVGDVIIATIDASGQWSIDRENGARSAFSKYPDIRVVQTVNTGSEPKQITSSIDKAMRSNPHVDGICCLDCSTVQAAADYVKRKKLKGKVLTVGFDEIPACLQLIKEGYIAAIFSQAPSRQAYEAVRMLFDFLNGKPISSVDTGITRIDIANVDEHIVGPPPTIKQMKNEKVINPIEFSLNPRIAQRVKTNERLFIPVSYHDISHEFVEFMRQGVERAARDFNIDAVLVGPKGPRVEEQIAELERLAEEGVDGLAISSAGTDALAPVIDRFIEQGIPVVTFNSDNPESGRLAFAGLQSTQLDMDSGSIPVSHVGEEWAMAIKGTLEFVIGEQSFTLHPGDTIYFDSSLQHHWKNIGPDTAEIIWVASPPHF